MLGVFVFFAISASLIYFSQKNRKELYKTKEELIDAKEKKRKEIRFEDKLYDVTDWINRHPGGKIIEFYTNNDEDASIAIQQFHQRSEKKVLAMLKSFKNRPVPEQAVVVKQDFRNQELSDDFYKLFKELQDEGLYEPSLIYVGLKIAELIGLLTLGMTLFLKSEGTLGTIVGMLILTLFQMRAGFFTHEAGHSSLTGSPKVDRILSSLSHGLGSGMSGSWWRNQHNKHHAMPQRLDHDVDLNTLPAIAFNVKVMKGRTDLYGFWLRHQAKTIVPLVAFAGTLRWKFHLNPIYALKKKEFLDILAVCIHIYGAYHTLGVTNYLLLQSLVASAMLITFSMSHSHLPVTEEPSHWVEYCTIHTMNVNPSWWCDYWMGYLNYQIEHHMFPTLPQFRLRSISGRVKALVLKHDLPYTCDSYGTALGKLFKNLSTVAKELGEQAKLAGQ